MHATDSMSMSMLHVYSTSDQHCIPARQNMCLLTRAYFEQRALLLDNSLMSDFLDADAEEPSRPFVCFFVGVWYFDSVLAPEHAHENK